ncbi:hypothetical protein M8998_08415 [Sphingobacterium sp. lm-10]|uniref:hypothetical protein n=1 Tax=Sphingobacterium sp. lm-10 TaxID=2944904 RepID=UPI002021E70A|nr:hypothetical protein [Sphingobacterium sp. lm-10]MCL7987959.1 hypothetical protein [Sphingobacterium sp. lm-10]
MIRPLEYCENTDHLKDSLQTIEHRIAELIELRNAYRAKAIALEEEIPTIALTSDTELPHAQ